MDEMHHFIHLRHFEPKPIATKKVLEESLVNLVESLFHVKFNDYTFLFLSFPFIYEFVCRGECIENLSPLYKSCLLPNYCEGENLFKTL